MLVAVGYGANNLRVATQDATGSKRILLNGMEELAEYSASTAVARYDHDPSRIDALLGQQVGATTVHATTDALGSVYALTDASSAAVTRYQYDAYGARTASAEATSTEWGFTGRVHDSAGEMYFRARYMDAGMGVFTQVDPVRVSCNSPKVPLGSGAGQRLTALARQAGGELVRVDAPAYSYVEQRPVVLVDPSGMTANCPCQSS